VRRMPRGPGIARTIVVLTALTPAGCGSAPAQRPPEDQTLVRNERLARLSFEQERLDQAATLYRQALDRAYERDDLQAIADLGYNFAVIDLQRGQVATALATAQSTRAEIIRRGATPSAELLLVESVALYRRGSSTDAVVLADAVVTAPDVGPETRARAIFVLGLAAADRADAASLAEAAAALSPTLDEEIVADRQELEGRLALLRGDSAGALAKFLAVADLRRTALEYRGMARALALAGGAATAAARAAEAADLYLRAGRSAQVQDDRDNAGAWLRAARDLGERSGARAVAAEATVRLDALATVASAGG
jgi:hypothetical protein